MKYMVEVVNAELGDNYHTVLEDLKEVSSFLDLLRKQKDEYVVTVNPINFRKAEDAIEEYKTENKPDDLEFGNNDGVKTRGNKK